MSLLTPTLKTTIDAMTVEELLRKHRFTPLGSDELFEGESGRYMCERIAVLRDQDNAAFVAASKKIGW